jgi:hypothetical protein
LKTRNYSNSANAGGKARLRLQATLWATADKCRSNEANLGSEPADGFHRDRLRDAVRRKRELALIEKAREFEVWRTPRQRGSIVERLEAVLGFNQPDAFYRLLPLFGARLPVAKWKTHQ